MKIAFVSDSIYPYFHGGKEKRLHELATRLARRGHDVHIYTMHWWNEPVQIKVEHGITLHAISRKRALYHGDKRSMVQALAFGFACLKLWRVRADVIDVDHMPFFPVFGAWVAHFFYARPLIGTWHEALSRRDWHEYMGKLGVVSFAIERMSTWLPAHIIAASGHTRHNLAAFHDRRNHVSVVASGIDTAQLTAVKPADEPCDILYVGRLVKDKRVDLLLRSFMHVLHTQPDTRLVIVGDGIERQNLEQLARELHIDHAVSFTGRVAEDTDIYRYMKKAKVFVSASSREGFGIVIIEAIACGTPVVVADSEANASKDLVEQGVTGSVVRATPQAFADACLQWLKKEPNAQQLADTARQFDWETLAERLEVQYQKVQVLGA